MLTQPKLTRPKSIPDLASRLAQLGYFPVPIPKGSKGPTLPGWDKLRLTPEDAPQYFTESEMLVGCLHVNLACFDIDVYDPDLAEEIIAEGFRRFPGALERIGAAPKSAIVLRLDEPGFKIHNTEKLGRTTADGEVIEAQVEVRTLTRQMVVYGKHPNTGQPYRWPRGELWATPIADLPALTKDAAQAFRDWCNERIRQWAGIAEKSAQVFDLGDFRSTKDDRPGEAEFIEALHHVPASLGHENGWRETLMAIHDFFGGSARGLDVAKDWSSADPRYTPQEVETKWRSFEVGKGVGYRSVFHHARQHGLNLSDLARKHRPKAEAVRAQDPNVSQFTPNFDHAPAPTPSDPAPQAPAWRVQTAADFTADFVAPEYIIDGIVQRGRIYTLTAPTGSGKTAAMLYAAAAIATGAQFCGREVEAGDVLFMAGENPDDVRARVIATFEFYGINPHACRLHFIAGTFSIRSDLERLREEAAKLPNLILVVVDTFAAYFDGDDENSNAQALDFARVIRRVAAFDAKPAVIMPAHPVKNARRDNLSPKGGSSLLNEVDGNLTLWNDGGILSLHWQGKFRGAEFDPLQMELQRYESSKICDNQGRIIPTILAKPLLNARAKQLAKDNLSLEDKLLFSIRDYPAISLEQRGTDCGRVNRQKVDRVLKKMAEQKLVRKFRTNWELTKDGERAIEIIENGAGFAPEI